MAVNNWTQKDLDALNLAIASGARKVKYTDKEIEYRSLDDMLRIRKIILEALGLAKKSNRLLANHSKGLC